MVDKIQSGLIILGTALGLAQIESILGIILLFVQLGLIIWKAVEKVRQSKTSTDTIKALEEAQQEIERLKNLTKEDK